MLVNQIIDYGERPRWADTLRVDTLGTNISTHGPLPPYHIKADLGAWYKSFDTIQLKK